MRAYSPDRDHKNKDDSMSYNGSANSLNKYHRSPYLQSNHHELQQNSQMVIVCPKNTKNMRNQMQTPNKKRCVFGLITEENEKTGTKTCWKEKSFPSPKNAKPIGTTPPATAQKNHIQGVKES